MHVFRFFFIVPTGYYEAYNVKLLENNFGRKFCVCHFYIMFKKLCLNFNFQKAMLSFSYIRKGETFSSYFYSLLLLFLY